MAVLFGQAFTGGDTILTNANVADGEEVIRSGTTFAGGRRARSRDYFRQVGTSPLESWYPQAGATDASGTGVVVTLGALRAYPFLEQRGGTLDRVGINVTVAAAGGVIRCGLYTATGDTNLYPDALVVDSGEFSAASTGVKSATISVTLTEQRLYYLVYLAGTAAPTIRGYNSRSGLPVLGGDNTLPVGLTNGLTVAKAYGALPGTYPAGATRLTNSTGVQETVWVRYGA